MEEKQVRKQKRRRTPRAQPKQPLEKMKKYTNPDAADGKQNPKPARAVVSQKVAKYRR